MEARSRSPLRDPRRRARVRVGVAPLGARFRRWPGVRARERGRQPLARGAARAAGVARRAAWPGRCARLPCVGAAARRPRAAGAAAPRGRRAERGRVPTRSRERTDREHRARPRQRGARRPRDRYRADAARSGALGGGRSRPKASRRRAAARPERWGRGPRRGQRLAPCGPRGAGDRGRGFADRARRGAQPRGAGSAAEGVRPSERASSRWSAARRGASREPQDGRTSLGLAARASGTPPARRARHAVASRRRPRTALHRGRWLPRLGAPGPARHARRGRRAHGFGAQALRGGRRRGARRRPALRERLRGVDRCRQAVERGAAHRARHQARRRAVPRGRRAPAAPPRGDGRHELRGCRAGAPAPARPAAVGPHRVAYA